ncbi:MAG: NfeD family protein [Phycisphaerales bacterium]|jgi:membrane-bound serine protease (ClpP class)
MDPLLVWGLLLLGISAFLGLLEFFVPSAGIIGIVALVVAIAGVVCLWSYETAWGITGMLGVLVIAPTATYFGFKVLPYTPIGKGLILSNPDPDDPSGDASNASHALRIALVGQEGMAQTDLRPIGVVKIEGQRHDAVAESGYIPGGSRVKVISADGIQLKVRQIQA